MPEDRRKHMISLPMYLFHIMAESTHEDGVSSELTEVAAGELEDLSCDAVLLHQRFLEQRHKNLDIRL